MTISYPLTLPSTGIRRITLRQRHVVGVGISPFTLEQQIQQSQGQCWEADIELRTMARADADAWIATLGQLLGMYGTFLLGHPARGTARGTVAGSPLVKGASQTGNSLITDAWTVGATILQGDFIQLGTGTSTRLYMNLKDVTADGSGDATLDIFPRLRESPSDNAAITVSSCKGTFRLASNDVSWVTSEDLMYGVNFSAIEAI